jgi:pSer/pThr/pTyr-binding forkhead associated (FHA) protein
MHGPRKDLVSIGSAPDNDVVLDAPGVAPRHAELVRRDGQILLIDLGAGATSAGGVPLGAHQATPFDFRTVFTLGQAAVPVAHPAIVRMLFQPGGVAAPPGQLVIGREHARASLVIAHASVSGHHATVMLDRGTVIDHGSTSGTWVYGQRIAPHQPMPFDPAGVISFGPVTIPVALLAEAASPDALQVASAPPVRSVGIASGLLSPAPSVVSPGQPAAASVVMSVPSQAYASVGEAPRKHRTIIGELSLDRLAAAPITIGRTPDNAIVVPHAQVSSRHAQIVREGGALFVLDCGSANGTFVRGRRIPAGQRVPVESGEKVYIGPMPLLIQVIGERVNVVVEDQVSWAGKPL